MSLYCREKSHDDLDVHSNGNKVHSKDKPALKTCQHRNLKNPWSGMPLATKQRSHVHKIRRGLRFGRPGYSMKQLFKGLKAYADKDRLKTMHETVRFVTWKVEADAEENWPIADLLSRMDKVKLVSSNSVRKNKIARGL